MNPESFENVQTKWFPEILEHCPDSPYILGMIIHKMSIVTIFVTSILSKNLPQNFIFFMKNFNGLQCY